MIPLQNPRKLLFFRLVQWLSFLSKSQVSENLSWCHFATVGYSKYAQHTGMALDV